MYWTDPNCLRMILGSSSNMYIVVPGKGSYIFVHFNSFRTIYTHLRPKENFKSQHKVIDVLNTKRTEQLTSCCETQKKNPKKKKKKTLRYIMLETTTNSSGHCFDLINQDREQINGKRPYEIETGTSK